MSEITKRIENMHEGQILFISDFSDLNGNEKVVSRALSAEEKKGNIVRLAKGMYLRPKSTRFGIVYPSVDEMVKAIAHRDKSKVQPCGMTALNMLGLSTQVPTKYTYLTSGSSRKLKLGDRLIELKRSVPKNFVFKTTLGALLMQALKSLGEKNISKQEIVQISKLIDNEKRMEHFKLDILLMPIWMRKLITNIINNANKS
ncbi:DUF6088 family protein [Prevotella sp. LMAG:51]|uniref:DUF6088 family protein n=1 Tax=Prevotella sp. LMAG:51 TaxID=1969564 RepID=UPI00257D8506|nr:DUF6088 family protein [Prevotella sp. LMAG:51]